MFSKRPRTEGSAQTSNAAGFDTAGARNNNPLNVKAPGVSYWRGQVEIDSRRHAVFSERYWGIRAAVITLRTYWFKHRLRTPAAILSRWAPASDTVGSLPGAPPNSPREYSLYVEGESALRPNAQLSLFEGGGSVADADQLFALLDAMSGFENGRDSSGERYRLGRSEFNKALKLV